MLPFKCSVKLPPRAATGQTTISSTTSAHVKRMQKTRQYCHIGHQCLWNNTSEHTIHIGISLLVTTKRGLKRNKQTTNNNTLTFRVEWAADGFVCVVICKCKVDPVMFDSHWPSSWLVMQSAILIGQFWCGTGGIVSRPVQELTGRLPIMVKYRENH